MFLSDKDADKLVKLIYIGKNTYADIIECLPELKGNVLKNLIGDDFKSSSGVIDMHQRQVLIFFQECPNDYNRAYKFKTCDSFKLSLHGENILYKLKEERKQNMFNWTMLILTAIACIFGAIASFTGIIGILR